MLRACATVGLAAPRWRVLLVLAVPLLVACGEDTGSLATGGAPNGVGGAGGEGGVSTSASGGAGGAFGSGGGGDCEPACGDEALCQDGACVCPEGRHGDPYDACLPVAELTGFIGSPCTQSSDCEYPDALCLPDGEGFSAGHCSLGCASSCPDSVGYPTTLCIDKGAWGAALLDDPGACFSRCDLAAYPNSGGCRPFYRCLVQPRPNDASYARPVCVPQSWTAGCQDPANLAGDDSCYFAQLSFGDPAHEQQARAILAGDADSAVAMAFLDQNYLLSQSHIVDQYGPIEPNYTPGHSASQPMTGMVVHYTANQREAPTINYFTGSAAAASTHFMIGSQQNGALLQLYAHTDRSWHAGSTYNVDRFGVDFANAGYLKQVDADAGWESYNQTPHWMWMPLHGDQPVVVNGGIPGLENKYAAYDHWQPYSYYQLLSYVLVGRALHKVYTLDPAAVVRHGDVSSSRVDPGPHMPFTFANQLVFSDDDVFEVAWLNAYKLEPNYIADHPEAR